MLNQLGSLFWARTKEYYRDKGSLVWSFILPPLIIAVVALAFSRTDDTLFTVGIYPENQIPPAIADLNYVKTVHFTDLQKAQQRIRYHQLDLLIFTDKPNSYQFNPQSQAAAVIRDILDHNDEWNSEPLSGRQVRYIDWVIPGILGMNLMFSGLFGVGYVIVRYRKNGVLKRLQAAPVSPLAFLSAQVLSRLLIMTITGILVYICCDQFLDFLMLGSYGTLFLIALLGNLSLLSLGLIVASRMANEELANGLLNLLTFPMMLLSEVWFSLDSAPAWMASVSQWLPLTHMVQAARAVMIEGATLGDIQHHLWILLLMTAVFLSLSAAIFSPRLTSR